MGNAPTNPLSLFPDERSMMSRINGPVIGRQVIALALLALGACATANWQLASPRDAVDVPARFEPVDAGLRLTPGDTLAGSGCLSPLVDPRDGTRISFIRSADVGDYEVEGGRYGVGSGELLRIECNTGRVIGIVGR